MDVKKTTTPPSGQDFAQNAPFWALLGSKIVIYGQFGPGNPLGGVFGAIWAALWAPALGCWVNCA